MPTCRTPAPFATWSNGVGRSFGPVDILVNNAGIQHVAPVEEFPPEKWDAILAINLSAAFHATRAVLPEMKRRGFGRIVNIASAHGLIASPFKSAYVAAKHGVVGLTKVVALEAAEHGVTCNAVCPGYVWTPLVEKQVEGQAKAHGISRDEVIRKVFLAEQPTRRFATVEEIAGTRRVPVRQRPPPPSPASHCRSMAAGRRTDMAQTTELYAQADGSRAARQPAEAFWMGRERRSMTGVAAFSGVGLEPGASLCLSRRVPRCRCNVKEVRATASPTGDIR